MRKDDATTTKTKTIGKAERAYHAVTWTTIVYNIYYLHTKRYACVHRFLIIPKRELLVVRRENVPPTSYIPLLFYSHSYSLYFFVVKPRQKIFFQVMTTDDQPTNIKSFCQFLIWSYRIHTRVSLSLLVARIVCLCLLSVCCCCCCCPLCVCVCVCLNLQLTILYRRTSAKYEDSLFSLFSTLFYFLQLLLLSFPRYTFSFPLDLTLFHLDSHLSIQTGLKLLEVKRRKYRWRGAGGGLVGGCGSSGGVGMVTLARVGGGGGSCYQWWNETT